MNDRKALLARAREAEERGDEVELESSLRELVAMAPNDPRVRVRLGSMLLERGDWGGSFEHLNAARELGNDEPAVLGLWSVAARRSKRLGRAVEVLREAARRNPSSTLLVLLSDALFELGLDDESRQSLEAAIELDPRNEEAYYNLAVSGKADDPTTALRLLDQAISIDPRYAEAFRERAYCLMILGDWLEAERALHQALTLEPDDPWALVYRGLIAMRQGLLDDAERDLTAVRERSGISMVHWLLGDVQMARGDLTGARVEYERAVQASPYNLENLQRLRAVSSTLSESYWSELLRAMEADDRMLREVSGNHPHDL